MATPEIQKECAQTDRITELDALRGLAVIGIIWMNVYIFALPSQGYYNPTAWGPGIGAETQADRIVWAVSTVFIEDKFRTLFAMLFGVGCLILLERSEANRWRAHYARMAVLFVIGLAHSILFASNDVLRAYAMAGCALPLIAHLGHRSLFAISIGLVAVHVGAGMIVFGSGVVDFYTDRVSSYAFLLAERNFGVDPGAIEYRLGQGSESLGERVARRSGAISSQLIAVSSSIPLNLAAMALGMGLWKDRMLTGEWRTYKLQRLAAICALLSIPALLALTWWVADNGFPGALVGAMALIISAPFDTLLGLAYAALAMAFFASSGALTQRLAAVGRLSLTNYLMTSVILAGIFASWGLGLFASVSRTQAIVISFVPIIAMLAWSPLWVARIGQGPFEKLWRSAAKLLS